MKKRARIIFRGIVQGVGFRPFIHKFVARYGLDGWVQNTTEGVTVEVEGRKEVIEKFFRAALRNKPVPSQINDVKISWLKVRGYKGFKIRNSSFLKEKKVLVTPDISICPQCIKELKDSGNRRYEHPFISCTDCGPRFTIIKDLPYDRKNITMNKFKMCPECKKEYTDINTRRYHTQPVACHDCGPAIRLVNPDSKTVLKGMAAISKSVKLLSRGKILAIKGLGGFHLACSASNSSVVKKLRKRKSRPFKPLAIMSTDIRAIRQYCRVNVEEEEMLTGWQHPIVLLEKKPDWKKHIAEEVSPGNGYLGVMLPYTPLHYILFEELKKVAGQESSLVMTSGNLPSLPLEIDNKTAMKRLSGIADSYLIHNRDIFNRCDDSIVRAVRTPGSSERVVLRRARGFVPLPVELGKKVKSALACGAELNSTFCLTKENRAFVSQYIGDLQNYENLLYYKQTVKKFMGLLDIAPEVVAHDLHPDYSSTKFALDYARRKGCRTVPVQHHHAHIAAGMLENGLNKKVIGVALDGTGYGTDGNIWGGEWLIADYRGFKRAGQLQYTAMPGGDRAVEEPWRMAVSYLHGAFSGKMPGFRFTGKKKYRISPIVSMIENNINAPLTSSMGRLFDGVSAMLGVCEHATYDAQPAMELEWVASKGRKRGAYRFEIKKGNSINVVDTSAVIEEIVRDMKKNIPVPDIALKFHFTVIDIIDKMSTLIRENTGINDVVLSGGVFQNRIIIEETIKMLSSTGFKVHYKKQYPCNDGGIALGQAAVAVLRK